MKSKKLLIALCVVCIFVQQPGICQTFDGECSTDDGTYSGKRNVTNTGKACYPWRSDNKCFKGITDVNSTFSHNYCRNPVDPSDCHQDLPWCYTDQNNGNWEFCDLPNCGSEPPENCSSPLGMGDGRISDDQIFAPTFMDQSNMAKYARLNETNANFWRASWSYPQYAYLSVNLRTPHFITKIHIQGTDYYFIKRFKILYSLDGYQWKYYTENKDDPNSAREFEGNHAGYDISIAYIKYPFIASKIAIIPVSFSNAPALRIELFGCVSPTNIPLVTEVTTIDSNTYWSLDRSPYIISAPTTIPPGVLLTIEADVKVIFTKPTASLTIYGCLELRGIKGLEVKFLTNNILSHMGFWKNPFNNDESFWNGIFINPDSIGCKISSLKHIIIVGAGITTGLQNIEFNNLKISNSKTGLKLTSINEDNVIRDCVFRQNLNGIETPRVGSLSVETSHFIENEVGVRLAYLPFPNEISTNFTFVQTLFRDNANGIYHEPHCMRIKMNFTISKSNFSNHREYAINAFQNCETESLYSVVSSVFSSSSIRIYSYSRDYSLQIQNSTVRDLFGKTGISIESRCKNLTLSGCTFANISGYSLRITMDISDSTIQINSSKFENNTGDGCLYFSGQQTSSIYLNRNTFLNNSVENVVNFYLPSSSKILLSKNIFKNLQSKYEISNNIIRSSNYSILASDNYWGVDDVENISSRIFDFYRDSSKSFVEILTYFKDENFMEIVNSSNYQSWLQKNGTVGGRVDVNTTLSSSSNLTVTKNIFIPKGSCLVIKGPIKLEFLAEKAIVVEGGCFHAEDSILTNRDVFWNGISFINSNGSFLSNVTITKTKLAFELTNSSVRMNKMNISSVKLARISGQNYNMLEIYNAHIVCSDSCIRVEDSLDMIMKVTNSSVTSYSDGFYLNNIKRLQFSLSGSTLDQKYQSLTFGAYILDGHVEISNCSSKGSIKMSSNNKFMIKESNFSSDSSCLQFESFYDSFPKNVTILDNVFNCHDNSISHVITGYYETNSSLIVARNKFLRGEIQISNRNPWKLIISNNFFNAILSRDKNFLEVILTGRNGENDKVLIANNVFENVLGISSVIKMSCFSEPYRGYVSAVYLKNNTFRNNSVTNTILTDCIGLTSEKNILNNPDSLYEMKVLGSTSNDVPQLMYFTRNFWGENVNDPNVRVYDETNDRTLMKVRVDPWYNDTTMTRLVFRSEEFIKPSGEIGGTLTQDVVINNKGSAYLVTEDITIPTGLKMTIEAGVKLNFVSGGMNIQGSLVARGNETDYITFNSRDKNKKWKGLNFQRPVSKVLRKLDYGWWQILHKGVWKTISLHDNSYKKQTADILCKQAGFMESLSQTIVSCNYLSTSEKSKVLPCNNSTTPSVKIQCTKNNELSLQECYISEYQNEFANITCVKDNRESEYYIQLQTKSGKWIFFNDKNNTLQLVTNLLNDEEGVFVKTSPCQNSQDGDCFSVMPLQRLGWYLRFYQNEILVDLASNNRNPSTFLTDSSFVRINKASSEYSYIKLAKQSLYLFENNNTLGISTFDPMNATDDSMYSFKIINLNQQSTRQKRDIGFTNDDTEFSIMQKVKIINADIGLFIRGIPPTLEDIEITDTSSHGIQFTGFFTRETPIFINRSSISNSGGNAIYIEMIGESGELEVLIEDSKLENCQQDCIRWNSRGTLNVSKSSFKNFTKSAIQANGIIGTSNISIARNSFLSSTSESVIILRGGVCEECYFAEILENKFINLTQFNSPNLLSVYTVFVTVIGNLFDNVSFYNLLSNYYGLSFSFENNIIANSRFEELLQRYDRSNFFIKNNVFSNNTGKYSSKLRTLVIYNNNDLKTNIINNSFLNPESGYEIFVHTNWDTSSYRILDLSMNKWIYGDYTKIMSKISCFYNDASKLPVNIWPAITVQNNSETLLTRPTSDNTYFFDATGGEVTFSFTIPNTTSKYIFQNSILIPANVTLSIEAGTFIEFASGRGIVAYGDLKIISVEGQFITLTKATKMDFYATRSDEMTMTNMFLDANEIKFNSGKLELSNMVLNSRTSVISRNTKLDNCSFYGGYNGITWNDLLPSSKLNYSTIVIQNSIFQKCSTAIKIPPIVKEIKIVNSTFLDNNQAFVLDYRSRQNFSLSVINCSFINNNYAVQGIVSEEGVIEISKCYFKKPKAEYGDATGIDLRMSFASMLNVNENVFEENVQPAIKLDINWNGVTDKKNVILQDNQFINISKSSITMLNMYGTDMNIYRNNFTRNNADMKSNVEVSAIDYGFTYDLLSYNWPLINVSFSQNNFHGNGGKHVVKIWNSIKKDVLLKAKYHKFELLSNSFLNNSPSDSVIATAIAVNISYNTFSNPLTRYDLVALFPSQFSQNCTMNDWGTNIPREIRNRIYDNKQDPLIGQVIYEPYLNKVNFSCEGVNSCSGHGSCVAPNVCQCDSEWDGISCSNHSCSNVYNCLGRGDCVALDTCSCNNGWTGRDCSVASCDERNNCSGRGICIKPNECTCFEQFSGLNCSECKSGRWGLDCAPCPKCEHGTCNIASGKCDCISPHWSGGLCEQCKPKFFKQNSITVNIKENTIGEKSLVTLNITEGNCYQNDLALSFSLEVLFPNAANVSSMFKMRELPGTVDIILTASLDREEYAEYFLEITATDSASPPHASSANITVLVEDENEFQPTFVNTSDAFYIDAEEGRLISRLYQFVAKDEDNDSITFMMVKSENSFYFMLDSSTGWLSVINPLNNSLTPEIMLQIVAKDNGNPAFETYLNVTIIVVPYKQATITGMPNSSAKQTYFGIIEILIVAAISIPFSGLAYWISF